MQAIIEIHNLISFISRNANKEYFENCWAIGVIEIGMIQDRYSELVLLSRHQFRISQLMARGGLMERGL